MTLILKLDNQGQASMVDQVITSIEAYINIPFSKNIHLSNWDRIKKLILQV